MRPLLGTFQVSAHPVVVQGTGAGPGVPAVATHSSHSNNSSTPGVSCGCFHVTQQHTAAAAGEAAETAAPEALAAAGAAA